MANGSYLVNGVSTDTGLHKSAIAWYGDLNRGNDGKQPDAYADVSNLEAGHFVRWEAQQIQGWPESILAAKVVYSNFLY
jgi:hypothetical protein